VPQELRGRRLLLYLLAQRHHFVRCPHPTHPLPPRHPTPTLPSALTHTNSCTDKSSKELCESVHKGGQDVASVALRVSLPQPLCYRRTIYAPAPHVHPLRAFLPPPPRTHTRPLTDPYPPQGIIVFFFGIAAAFLAIGGAYSYLHSYQWTMHVSLLITGNLATVCPTPVAQSPILTHALLRAGILNTIGGGYCIKAKSAMDSKAISPA
jgi:hypothetical protein